MTTEPPRTPPVPKPLDLIRLQPGAPPPPPKSHTLQVAGLVCMTALTIAGAAVGFAIGAVASEYSTSMCFNVGTGATVGSMIGWSVGLFSYAVMKAN